MSPPEPHKPTADETQVSADARCGPCALPLASVAVAQTPGDAAGSFLRVGSEIGHRITHERCLHAEVVTASRAGGHLRDHPSASPRRLYATATSRSSTPRVRSWSSSNGEASASPGWRDDPLLRGLRDKVADAFGAGDPVVQDTQSRSWSVTSTLVCWRRRRTRGTNRDAALTGAPAPGDRRRLAPQLADEVRDGFEEPEAAPPAPVGTPLP
jgi:hypothetical protein